MSICYATEFEIDLMSKNQHCSFYVVRCAETEKYHVFVVVFQDKEMNAKKGYIMSSHEDKETAMIHKNTYQTKLSDMSICR